VADSTGWAKLGAALGGDSELEYQKGLALGAQTQNAMAEARARVDKADAQRNLANQLRNAGLPYDVAEASATTLAAGGGLGDVIGALGKQQEQGFRTTAGAPGSTDTERQAALAGVASGPIDVYKNVGPRAYQNLLHPEQGVMPLGDALSGSAGGEAAGIQALRAFHLLGPDSQVVPGKEEQAFNVFRTTQQLVNTGGVPGAVNANPYTPRATPIAPGQPAAPIVTPLSTPEQTAANVGTIAEAKKIGTMRAEATVTLPDALGELDYMKKNINSLLAKPGLDSIYGARVGTDIGQKIATFASQDAADAAAAREQLAANAFGISIQKNRGLGQLSDAEGRKFSAAFTRATNPKIGTEEAKVAWAETLQYLDLIQARLKQKATGVAPGSTAAPAGGGPQPGTVEAGYRFKGGNPADQANWEPVQ
jgi:hypothetical protein